ncbi:FecR family protein [Sphingobacterium sp. SYP-B4668]|uniref:FecR family protein n=1 Tax=Sphingobacterium sp. SYP-B4668 TaxID=2996035 RepID=UPI0022DCEE49|nr:FecR family protein [Sphingobacterium sp. SYP-B4668]
MQNETLKSLLIKYAENNISRDELHHLLSLLEDCDESIVFSIVDDLALQHQDSKTGDGLFNKSKVLSSLSDRIQKHQINTQSNLNTRRIGVRQLGLAVAALVVCFLSVTFLLRLFSNDTHQQFKNEIVLPDESRPVLTLGDGKQYTVAETELKTLREGGIHIKKDSTGHVLYKINDLGGSEKVQHTFLSPKGTASILELAEGTKVYLNSGASITYPSQFHQNIREVTLHGEAYLEVSHDASRPFVVHAQNTDIQVLGTQFNIAPDLYNTKIITTLVQGKVTVSNGATKQTLLPGMQSQSDTRSQQITVSEADIKEVLAWREGYFRFSDDDMETVLLKIQGWYDIKGFSIQTTSSAPIVGMVKRTNKLSDFLRQLEEISNCKFKIQDGRVLVM